MLKRCLPSRGDRSGTPGAFEVPANRHRVQNSSPLLSNRAAKAKSRETTSPETRHERKRGSSLRD
ncbi:MAG: hypothetical protein DME22_09675 [Verrucomicrobia bacterium]|nr:MAG: hypothetical protein DME22_09675 [Verrucomicrobiota bacterium]